jgi:hypothetical protein
MSHYALFILLCSISLGAIGLILLFCKNYNFINNNTVAWSAFASLLFFTLYLVRLFFRHPRFFVLIFLFALDFWGASLGSALIESGAYISEQLRYGYQTGSTVRLVFYSVILIGTAQFFYNLLVRRHMSKEGAIRFQRIPRTVGIIVNILLLGLVVFLLASFLIYGTVFEQRVDRFVYRAQIAPDWLIYISGYLYQLVFLSGLSLNTFRQSRFIRVSSLVGFLGSLIVVILQGEKFTGLLLLTHIFWLPSILTSSWDSVRTGEAWRKLRRYIPLTFLVASASFVLIIYHYSNFYGSKNTFEMLSQRLALHGHVWWGTDENVLSGRNSVDAMTQLEREFNPFASPEGRFSPELGIGFLMTLVAPWPVVQAYYDMNVRFAMGYPAIALYIFGYAGLILFQLIAGAILALFLLHFSRAILMGNFIRAFILLRLYFVLVEVFIMGELYRLYSYKVWIYLAALAVIGLVASQSRIKGKRMPQWI